MSGCYICHGHGLIQVRHKVNKGLYVFKCECHRGEWEKCRNFPVWKGIYEIDYDPYVEGEESGPQVSNNVITGRFGPNKTDDQDDKDLEIF